MDKTLSGLVNQSFLPAWLFLEIVPVRNPILSPNGVILNQSQLSSLGNKALLAKDEKQVSFLPKGKKKRKKKNEKSQDINRKQGKCLKAWAYHFYRFSGL